MLMSDKQTGFMKLLCSRLQTQFPAIVAKVENRMQNLTTDVGEATIIIEYLLLKQKEAKEGKTAESLLA